MDDETRHTLILACSEHNEREQDAVKGKKSVSDQYSNPNMKEI